MKHLTYRLTELGPFFPNLGHVFRFSKEGRGAPLPPRLIACLPSCLDEAKVSIVNSDLVHFGDVQRFHENIK